MQALITNLSFFVNYINLQLIFFGLLTFVANLKIIKSESNQEQFEGSIKTISLNCMGREVAIVSTFCENLFPLAMEKERKSKLN